MMQVGKFSEYVVGARDASLRQTADLSSSKLDAPELRFQPL